VSVRKHGEGDLGVKSVGDAAAELLKEIDDKGLSKE
jgi:hypothetical protein